MSNETSTFWSWYSLNWIWRSLIWRYINVSITCLEDSFFQTSWVHEVHRNSMNNVRCISRLYSIREQRTREREIEIRDCVKTDTSWYQVAFQNWTCYKYNGLTTCWSLDINNGCIFVSALFCSRSVMRRSKKLLSKHLVFQSLSLPLPLSLSPSLFSLFLSLFSPLFSQMHTRK